MSLVSAISAVAISVLLNQPMDNDVYGGPEINLSLKGENAYIFGTYATNKQSRLSQRMGKVVSYGAGVGFENNGWFVELGYGDQKFDSDQRVAQEVAYHFFLPDFGVPPFASNWTEVKHLHKTEGEVFIKIGYERELYKGIIGQVAYKHWQVNEYWRIWNPDFLVDNAEGGKAYPYWEGDNQVNNSTISIGLKWEF